MSLNDSRRRSGNGRANAWVPLSPMEMRWYLSRFLLTSVRSSRTRFELMEPQRPLVRQPVGGHGDGHDLVGRGEGRLGEDERVVLENLLHEIEPEVLARVQPLHVHAHFGGRDHLHGLGDLPDAVHGLHPQLDGLFVGGEAVRRCRDQTGTQAVE